MRVGQQGTLGAIWARLAKGSGRRSRMEWQGEGERGSCPVAERDCRRDWAYMFGAVCPARTAGEALVMPSVNIDAMNLHLRQISARVAPGAHAALVLDGAGWHRTGGALTVPDNITRVRLPPYCPELNPIENVWEYLRGNTLNMTVWDRYDAIVEACCKTWTFFTGDVDRVASVTTRAWAKVNL